MMVPKVLFYTTSLQGREHRSLMVILQRTFPGYQVSGDPTPRESLLQQARYAELLHFIYFLWQR
jgi:hypothetical protein